MIISRGGGTIGFFQNFFKGPEAMEFGFTLSKLKKQFFAEIFKIHDGVLY